MLPLNPTEARNLEAPDASKSCWIKGPLPQAHQLLGFTVRRRSERAAKGSTQKSSGPVGDPSVGTPLPNTQGTASHGGGPHFMGRVPADEHRVACFNIRAHKHFPVSGSQRS